MILHTVVFSWKEDVKDADISRLETDLHSLAADVGAVSFETARDGGFRAGAADFVVLGRFTDEVTLLKYLEHPAHHQLLDNYARAMVERKESVQAILN